MSFTILGKIQPIAVGDVTLNIGKNSNDSNDVYFSFGGDDVPQSVDIRTILETIVKEKGKEQIFKSFLTKAKAKKLNDFSSFAKELRGDKNYRLYAKALDRMGWMKTGTAAKVKDHNAIVDGLSLDGQKIYNKPSGLKKKLETITMQPSWRKFEGKFLGKMKTNVCVVPDKAGLERNPYYIKHIKPALKKSGISLLSIGAFLREVHWEVSGSSDNPSLSFTVDAGQDITNDLLALIGTDRETFMTMVKTGDGTPASLSSLGFDIEALAKPSKNNKKNGASGGAKLAYACKMLGGEPVVLEADPLVDLAKGVEKEISELEENQRELERLNGLIQPLEQQLEDYNNKTKSKGLSGGERTRLIQETEAELAPYTLESERLKAQFPGAYKVAVTTLKEYGVKYKAYLDNHDATSATPPQAFAARIKALKASFLQLSAAANNSANNSTTLTVVQEVDALLDKLSNIAQEDFATEMETIKNQFDDLSTIANAFADDMVKMFKGGLNEKEAEDILDAITAVNTARKELTDALTQGFSESLNKIIELSNEYQTVEELSKGIRAFHKTVLETAKINQKFVRFEKAVHLFVQKAGNLNATIHLSQTISNTNKMAVVLRKLVGSINKLPAIFTNWFKGFVPKLTKHEKELLQINKELNKKPDEVKKKALLDQGNTIVVDLQLDWDKAFVSLDKINAQIITIRQNLKRAV